MIRENVISLGEKGKIDLDEALSIWASNPEQITAEDIIDIYKFTKYLEVRAEKQTDIMIDVCAYIRDQLQGEW